MNKISDYVFPREATTTEYKSWHLNSTTERVALKCIKRTEEGDVDQYKSESDDSQRDKLMVNKRVNGILQTLDITASIPI